MDEYSNLLTISLEILIKINADGQDVLMLPGLRFRRFRDFTTLLPPSYVHWWTYYCQKFEKYAFCTFFDSYPSCQFTAKYPRYRSRLRISDDPKWPGTPLELSQKIEGRNSCLSQHFFQFTEDQNCEIITVTMQWFTAYDKRDFLTWEQFGIKWFWSAELLVFP